MATRYPKEQNQPCGLPGTDVSGRDRVLEASVDSFPASDPVSVHIE